MFGLIGIGVLSDQSGSQSFVDMKNATIESKINQVITAVKQKYQDPASMNSLETTAPRVGLQVGHWQNDQVPSELEFLTRNTGASASGKNEPEVTMVVALRTKEILEAAGIIVDLLPATVPPDYLADAFVSIHADGSTNTSASGFKIAPPRRDASGIAHLLSQELTHNYAAATEMKWDHNITRNMTNYYAFNHRRFEHSIHPSTPAALVELGFMTNPTDLDLILNHPHKPAQGIADGILSFLESQNHNLSQNYDTRQNRNL